MIERDVALILVGAGIGFVGSIVTAVAAHFLRLREDSIKRDRDWKKEGILREQAMIDRRMGQR